MGAKYTDAQKRATLKYSAAHSQINISVSTEQRDRYQQLAASMGKSLTQLITELLEGCIKAQDTV